MKNICTAAGRFLSTVTVALLILGLAACLSFGPDQKKINEVDEQVAGFNLAEAGEVIAEYSTGSGTSYAIYTHQIVLRGPGVVNRVEELLRAANFELQPSTAFGTTYQLRTAERKFTVTITTFEENTEAGGETGNDENRYHAKAGDVRVTISSYL